MQYQHLVFEEFARKVQPALDAIVLKALVERNGSVDFEAVDDVIFGNVDSVGPQAGDVADQRGVREHPALTIEDEGV